MAGVTFKVEMSVASLDFTPDMGVVHKVTELVGGELYEGDYVVRPEVDQQTLPTATKLMRDDLTVLAIPRHEVDNDAGGQTCIIGGTELYATE